MRKLAFLLLLGAFAGNSALAKVSLELEKSSTETLKKDSKTKGFILHKEKYHSQLTPVVDKSVFSVVEMGTCEVKIQERSRTAGSDARKYKVWTELEYRLCQKVDFYQAKDVSYFGMIHRKGIFDQDDYRKTRYISQEDDEAERKVFRVGSVDHKSLKEIESKRNSIYQAINSGGEASKASLAALERDEDVLKNVLEQALSSCEAHKESILKNENRSNENFCEE